MVASHGNSGSQMNIDLSNFPHNNILTFSFSADMNLQKVINIKKRLPSDYKPPNINVIGGEFFAALYDVNW